MSFDGFNADEFEAFEDLPFSDRLDDLEPDELRKLVTIALLRSAELSDTPLAQEVAGMFWGYVIAELEESQDGNPNALRNVEMALAPMTGGAHLLGAQRVVEGEGEGGTPNLPEFL